MFTKVRSNLKIVGTILFALVFLVGGLFTTNTAKATNNNPCSDGIGSATPTYDTTLQITNDPDSSNAPSGADWATDTITRHLQIWESATPGTFCAQATDTGTFTTFGGDKGISPQSGLALPEIVTGTITGNIGPVSSTIVPTDSGNWGNTHSIDCNNLDTCSTIGVWMKNYFGDTFSPSYDWSWTYKTDKNGTWTNATISNGDIIPSPVTLSSVTITADSNSSPVEIGNLSGATLLTNNSGSCNGNNAGTASCHTLNITKITMSDGKNLSAQNIEFKLNASSDQQTSLKSYFSKQTGWTSGMTDQINSEITGISPFFYLTSNGSGVYSLADGFTYGLSGGTIAPLVIDDNYPAGDYTFVGKINNSDVSVTLHVVKPILNSATITADSNSSPVEIGNLSGATLLTNNSGSCNGNNAGTASCHTLNVSDVLTTNGNLPAENEAFTMQATDEQKTALTTYFASLTGTMATQIASEIAGSAPFFYFVSNGSGTYNLADGFKWGLGAINQPLVIDDNYPAGDYTFIGTIAGVSKKITLTVTKPTPTVTKITCPTSVSYTGSALTPCIGTVTGAGGLNQSVTVTYSDNTNVGTATAHASYAGDTYHTGSSATDVKFSIVIDPKSTSTVLTTTENEDKTISGIIPNDTSFSMNTSAGNVNVEIPAGINITGPSGWDGKISAPSIANVTLPVITGQTSTLTSAIELGSTGVKLTFDKAVKIIMPGQAGKKVGYTRGSDPFTEITNVCATNSQDWANTNIATGSECKMDVGSDLIVWTKHFTKFATYTQTINPIISSGGSSYTPVIVNNIKDEGCLPSNLFSVTTGKACPKIATSISSISTDNTQNIGQVLGAEKYNFTKLLKKGSQGNEIIELQKFLNTAQYNVGVVDGKFGPKTKAAVIKFQIANKLKGDGIIGAKTRVFLNK